MKVMKFGGSSLASPDRIRQVMDIVIRAAAEAPVLVVVSAFGGGTDQLLEAAHLAAHQKSDWRQPFEAIEKRHLQAVKELLPLQQQSGILSSVKRQLNQLETLFEGCFLLGELSPRTCDTIMSFGELLSAYIVAEAMKEQQPQTLYADSRELIMTNNHFGKAMVDMEATSQRCQAVLADTQAPIVVLPGFVASSSEGHTTTLGRGGSDYSAAIFAGILGAGLLEIWTDVSGMYTANPTLVKQAHPIAHISYEEALELSHFGAKVLYPPTIQPVLDKNIPIRIKNTFDPQAPGTLVTAQGNSQRMIIKGISHIDNVALLTLSGTGLIGIPGSSRRLFEVLSLQKINIILITQASSEHSICMGLSEGDAARAKQAIDEEFAFEISLNKVQPCEVEMDLAIIAIVGENMKNHQGVSGRMFSTLGQNNVNCRAIAQGSSERNISTVIHQKDVKKAVNSLHERFFEEDIKQLNLFIAGTGNVGAKLLEQLHQQHQYLRDHLRLDLRVVGLCNSRQMVLDPEGISLTNWPTQLAEGEKASLQSFYERVLSINKRNSLFVDNTASEEVSTWYEAFLSQSIAVVTCNKIACSSSLEKYHRLKGLARKFNAPFLFETNVGAGLPIIDTLKNLVASGDEVHRIQAVLSGSLNFVFNHFNEGTSFRSVVEEAMHQGYTEPDPRIDLSGVDVMRKILILARESGRPMEFGAIENRSFLPKECLETPSVEVFLDALDTHQAHFQALLMEANQKEARLKFVATLEGQSARVGLEMVDSSHPFYHLEGKDNIVLFYTDRYPEQPLLVKGAGAGAAVTASGIFADIIRIGKV
jgi:bifunctional aspartokinase / homoserine dehydrogenase 1